MPPKSIPARPHIEHYKKQAKELLKRIKQGDPSSIERLKASHPKHSADPDNYQRRTLADAQMVIAREHGHATWADFARQIASITSQLLAEAQGPSHAFLIAASVPREGSYASGNVTQAEELLRQHPEVADASVFTAAVLGNTATVQRFLLADPSLATAEDGPYNWDALTYLCFSRYLRLDKQRSDGFVATARTLLDAGANANTGWWEENTGEDRAFWESAIYGAAGVAQHASLTRLLLEYGANPNDEETPYHIPETTDLSVLKVILDSCAMTDDSLTMMLLRKTDWHDREGIRLLLEAGASPNRMTRWGNTALHQALRRDNALQTIELMLDHGADFSIITKKDGISAFALAARRGRGDVLRLLISRGIEPNLEGVDR